MIARTIFMKTWMIAIKRYQYRSWMMPFEKNSDFTSADVAMLGHGFGVSQRLKFYDQHL